jgi:TetR/AcrR family transcriptional repressor of nem operon
MVRSDTREKIIRTGGEIIARHGFGTTGINAVLSAAGIPKGSFYHYFPSKNDFGLAVIDAYASDYDARLEALLGDTRHSPLQRLRAFFETGIEEMQSSECVNGCLIGTLGQELAAHNELFRARLDDVFAGWERRISACVAAAREAGEIAAEIDADDVAGFLLAGWEGAILRAKVIKSVRPMQRFVHVVFSQVLPRSG